MKKIISILLIAVLVLSGCSTNKTLEYNLEVTAEPFEDMTVIPSMGTYKKYSSEAEIFEDSDLVIVGMPVNTMTDEAVVYYDKNSKLVTKDDDWLMSNTIRQIKVLEVLKGECATDNVEVIQMCTVDYDKTAGEGYIRGLSTNEFVAKKNVKYIYYLKDSKDPDIDYIRYYACADQGVVNIDGLDNNSLKCVNSNRLAEINRRFDAQFEKYDRTAELVTK